jgi:hypothetical protein
MVMVLGAAALSILLGTTTLSAPAGAGSAAVTPTVWAINFAGDTLLAFPLSASGNVTPAVTISANGTSLDGPFGTEAFDASGDMWIPNVNANTLVEYTPSQLASSGDPTPAVTISDNAGSLSETGSVAFDRSGDLWALNETGTMVKYTPSQLAASGNPTPAVTISSPGRPYGFAFDGAGDLWVADFSGSTVVEYTPSQLVSSGNPTPAVTISANAGSLGEPSGVAFDASGDLWVGNVSSNTLVDYTPSQLAASGSPTPAVTISANAGSLNGPFYFAFDAAGDLWVTNTYSNTIAEYTPSQLAASGSPTPADTISGAATGMDEPGGAVIEQAPAVTTIAPMAGPPSGGTTVTIHGTGFNYGSKVDFGSNPASSVTYLSPYELTAVSPPGSGTVDVTVSTFAGTSATSAADQYTYTTNGYWEVASDGGMFAFGGVGFYGSMGGTTLNMPVVGLAATPDRKGYWEVASDGGLFAFGDATFYGSMGGKPLNSPIVGMATDPATGGYWEVATDGGMFSFNAPFYGSTGGTPLNQPVVGMASTPDGGGYWLVAKDGGIFAFGDAKFFGSMGGKPLNAPVVGIAASPSGGGYWEVASDGGMFAFDAPFYGSMGGKPLNKPMVGLTADTQTGGYWEVASDGGLFGFNAPFFGSMGGQPLNKPVVGMAAD